MKKGLTLILFILQVFVLKLHAQIQPIENSSLNYRLIGFKVPALAGNATKYSLLIAEGAYLLEDEFAKNISQTFTGKTNAFIEEVKTFGRNYTWQIICVTSSDKTIKSPLYHFNTQVLPVEYASYRMHVTTPAKKYADAYVFNDGNKMLYNMKGEPVWFLPNLKNYDATNRDVRDIKASNFGTITILGEDGPREIDYNGNTLWEPPKNADANITGEGNFHHDLNRLRNGNYMIMGNENRPWKKCEGPTCDSNSLSAASTAAPGGKTILAPFTTIIEYNAAKKVVWRWSSFQYLLHSDIFFHKGPDGTIDIDAHANAFYLNEKEGKLYISFKNINRIVVVSYPGGKVLREYGPHFGNDGYQQTALQFSEQHSVRASASGLYLYNNNEDHKASGPSIVVFKEPAATNEALLKTWDFKCPQGPDTYSDIVTNLNRHGGKVKELEDKSYFVSNCSPYFNLFIVNKNKQLLWEAVAQKIDPVTKKWTPTNSYRSDIITSHEVLSKIIWNTSEQSSLGL